MVARNFTNTANEEAVKNLLREKVLKKSCVMRTLCSSTTETLRPRERNSLSDLHSGS